MISQKDNTSDHASEKEMTGRKKIKELHLNKTKKTNLQGQNFQVNIYTPNNKINGFSGSYHNSTKRLTIFVSCI